MCHCVCQICLNKRQFVLPRAWPEFLIPELWVIVNPRLRPVNPSKNHLHNEISPGTQGVNVALCL